MVVKCSELRPTVIEQNEVKLNIQELISSSVLLFWSLFQLTMDPEHHDTYEI